MSVKYAKYMDVFNNPYNDYVCPTFPTCSNDGNDDNYFEFIDKQSVGIVNNKATLQSMDLKSISSYVNSWSQETKVIQPKKTLFIRGDEYSQQIKIVEFTETGDFQIREKDKSYYFNVHMMFFDDYRVKYLNIFAPIYNDYYDLETAVSYIDKYLNFSNTPIKISFSSSVDSDSLGVFDVDSDKRVDVWWDGEKHIKGKIIIESTDEEFRFHIMSQPSIKVTESCESYTEGEFIIVNGSKVDVTDMKPHIDVKDIIESMDGGDKDGQANIYWSEFDGIKPTPNYIIPKEYDNDSDGFVDIVWVDTDDESSNEVCNENMDQAIVMESVKFVTTYENNYMKYTNGAFKGISVMFNYPKLKGKFNTVEEIDDNLKYIHYIIPNEKFIDIAGEESFLYMDGPLYNGDSFIDSVNEYNGWLSTSLLYMNISNNSELIRGMMLYNPHNFPIAATYIKFN